jgi:hypothetical protein
MAKKYVGFLGVAFLLFFFSGSAMAQHGHGHGDPATASPSKPLSPKGLKGKGGIQSVTVEGWKIMLEVMSMGEHMKHAAKGGTHSESEHSKSHSIMVTIQDTASQEIISDAKVMFSVSSASEAEESGKLEWSGDHYAGGFSPKAKGTYQVQLKIAGAGMEREAKFSYEAKK